MTPPTFVAPPTAEALSLEAMAAMEKALTALVAEKYGPNVPDEIEKAFDRYQRIKAKALNPGTPAEGRVALRQALIDGVKLAF